MKVFNDIGLLKLWKEVELNERVQLACLPRKTLASTVSYPQINTDAYFAGWGKDDETKANMRDLKNMRIRVLEHNDPKTRCRLGQLDKDWNIQICAGDLNAKI